MARGVAKWNAERIAPEAEGAMREREARHGAGAVVLAVGFRPRQHDAFAPVGLESRSHLRGVLPRYPRPAFAISGARAKRSASTAWRC